MKNISFFISFDFFKFKDIKDKDLKNNFDNHFVYKINAEFNKLVKECENDINKFHTKILGNNNNLLFYTGMESKIKKQIEQYESEIQNVYSFSFENENVIDKEVHYIKIKVGKGRDKQKFSLCCLLLVINRRKVISNINESEMSKHYILFPIRYGDVH